MESIYDELGSLKDCLIDNVQVEKIIGHGAYGTIGEAKWEGSVVAIKEIHSIFNEVGEEQFQALKTKFLTECKRSSQLRHPNIVRFLGICLLPGARVPSLVMERLHCNLTELLEQNAVIPLEIKLSILHQALLGLRYLHTRAPPIIHRDLSSNNILVSKGMEAKIADFGTIRILEPNRQTPMSLAPGTKDFMPPEAVGHQPVGYKQEIDIFSFGCVMLHTFSHTWPTPSQSVIADSARHVLTPQSEVQRRAKYLDKVPKEIEDIIIPLIKNCLEYFPNDQPSAEQACEQLETLIVNRKWQFPDNMLHKHLLLQELQDKVAQKSSEINDLQTQLTQSRLANKASLYEQTSKRSLTFWRGVNLTWTQCTDLPRPCWVSSIAELDGNVYITSLRSDGGFPYPYKYDSNKNRWSSLPALSCIQFTLVTIPTLKQLLAIGGLQDSGVIATDKVFVWEGEKWTTPYPNMPTARFQSAAIHYQSKIIVAGGVIKSGPPRLMTRAVEVLHIDKNHLSNSYWSVVEQMPYISNQPGPLLIDDKLYITVGFNKIDQSQTDIAVVSIPALLQDHTYASGGQIWEKLPDLPYPSPSINAYQKRLVTFGGVRLVEQPNGNPAKWQMIPLIHIYNPDTKSWDCVGEIPHGYYLGRSVHIGGNKILFVGGTIGKYVTDSNDDLVTTCSLLTITRQ